ncbi:MAG: NYN domain-containing protein [Candidatus Buchananbacteria bacterium]|nr:NYN domain-containing protein [Candidatus Buchananbacteria bacterium]
MANILFIDGENFKKKIKDVLISEKITNEKDEIDWTKFNFKGLFDQILQGIDVDRRIFYFAKINKHKATPEKSELLIQKTRNLKTYLESEGQGFEVTMAGNVRGYPTEKIVQDKMTLSFGKKEVIVFKEKGVDVKIAVDMVSMSCDDSLNTAILASSDSDLQPAIKEVGRRNKICIYVGFENSQNKGIAYTANRTILIRNSEVLNNYQRPLI